MDRSDYLGVGFFVKPLPMAAVALIALNDHYLKYAYPSWWTGKLSDFAGLFFFPLFLCALYVLLANLTTRKPHWISRAGIIAAIVVTDLIFIAVKTLPVAAVFYEQGLGWLGFPSRVTMDVSDLFALSMNTVTYWYASKA